MVKHMFQGLITILLSFKSWSCSWHAEIGTKKTQSAPLLRSLLHQWYQQMPLFKHQNCYLSKNYPWGKQLTPQLWTIAVVSSWCKVSNSCEVLQGLQSTALTNIWFRGSSNVCCMNPRTGYSLLLQMSLSFVPTEPLWWFFLSLPSDK